MKLLLLSYHFPPAGGVGVQRVIKLLKYLPQYGIEPVVVTPNLTSFATNDPELLNLEEVNKCKVYRIGGEALAPFLARRISEKNKTICDYQNGIVSLPFIDIYQLWSRKIVKQVEKVVIDENIDCIYSTSPPHSIHLLGSALRLRRGLPWIMELRDSMTEWPLRKPGLLNSLSREVERFHEKQFYKRTDGVVFVAKGQLENAITRVPSLKNKPILVVPNGFDRTDYSVDYAKNKPDSEFIITFTGNLSDHNIERFCQIVSQLSGTLEIGYTTIRLKIVGILDNKNKRLLKQLPSSVQVDIVGFVSHKEAIEHQRSSHCLLLLQTANSKGNGGEMINAKLFEYLATGLPIVAITPRGEQWDIVEKSNLGKPASPDDLDAIKDSICYAYKLATTELIEINQEFISSFSRQGQVKAISEFVRAVCNQSDFGRNI